MPGTYPPSPRFSPTLTLPGSSIRPIPDTQEVFVSVSAATSLSVIIDLLSSSDVVGTTSDAQAAYHFRDALEEPGVEVEITRYETVKTGIQERAGTSVLGRVKGRSGEWTVVVMTVVRLLEVGTDLVVSVNVPEEEGAGDAKLVSDEVVGSLRVVDWGLFGDAEE